MLYPEVSCHLSFAPPLGGGARNELVPCISFHPNIDISVSAFMFSFVSFQSHRVNCPKD